MHEILRCSQDDTPEITAYPQAYLRLDEILRYAQDDTRDAQDDIRDAQDDIRDAQDDTCAQPEIDDTLFHWITR